MNTRFVTDGKNLTFLAGNAVRHIPTSQPSLYATYLTYATLPTILPIVKVARKFDITEQSEKANPDLLDPMARPIALSEEVYFDGGGI